MLTTKQIQALLTNSSLEVRDMAWELLAARKVAKAAEAIVGDYMDGIEAAVEAKLLDAEEAARSLALAATLKAAIMKHGEARG